MSASGSNVLFDAPGPSARARHRIAAVIGAVVLVGVVVFVLVQFGRKGQLEASKWTPFLTGEIWQFYLIPGLLNTLKAAAISIVLSAVFGFVFGIGRLSTIAPIRWVSTVVVEVFRSIPVLVMMIAAFAYYSYNNIFVSSINPLAAVVTGLTLYNGSVVAELLRSGVGSLPKGQAEAGLSIGLTRGQTLRSIQLPQAITAMLPALVGQLVVVLKDTALGQIITYPELLNTYQQIGSYKSNPVPAMIVIALIFIVINYALTTVAARVDSRLRRRGRASLGATLAAGGGGAAILAADPELSTADQPGEDLQDARDDRA